MYVKVYRQYVGEECVEFSVDSLPANSEDMSWSDLNTWLEENANASTILDDKYIEVETILDVEVV